MGKENFRVRLTTARLIGSHWPQLPPKAVPPGGTTFGGRNDLPKLVGVRVLQDTLLDARGQLEGVRFVGVAGCVCTCVCWVITAVLCITLDAFCAV